MWLASMECGKNVDPQNLCHPQIQLLADRVRKIREVAHPVDSCGLPYRLHNLRFPGECRCLTQSEHDRLNPVQFHEDMTNSRERRATRSWTSAGNSHQCLQKGWLI